MILQTSKVKRRRRENVARLIDFYGPAYRKPGGAKYRAKFFAEDGVKHLAYPVVSYDEMGKKFSAKEQLLNQKDYGLGLNLDLIINPTDNPDVFWVEAMEYGPVTICGKTGEFHGRSMNLFRFEEGKIKLWREYATKFPVRRILDETGENQPWCPKERRGDPGQMFPIPEEMRTEWDTKLNPHLVLKDAPVKTEDGMTTRVYVVDDACDDSVEADIRRVENLHTVYSHFGPKVRMPRGGEINNRFFSERGLGTFDFMLEDYGQGKWQLIYDAGKEDGMGLPANWNMDTKAVYLTPDPNVFWAEKRLIPLQKDNFSEVDENDYFQHYVMYFKFDDAGKILLFREFADQENEYLSMGYPVSKLPEEAEAFIRGM